MIWFWIVAGLLILVALAALLAASRFGEPGAARTKARLPSRCSAVSSRISTRSSRKGGSRPTRPPPHEPRSPDECSRQPIGNAKKASSRAANPARSRGAIGAAVGVAGLLPAAALAIYFAVGAPAAINPPARPGPGARGGPTRCDRTRRRSGSAEGAPRARARPSRRLGAARSDVGLTAAL